MGVAGFLVKHRGDFKNTKRFLDGYNRQDLIRILNSHGDEGIRALASATPKDSGITANSWRYEVEVSRSSFSIKWVNDNLTSRGTPIVILLQYGHATKSGGYVQGKDYINPAIQPIFDKIADAVWREVVKT